MGWSQYELPITSVTFVSHLISKVNYCGAWQLMDTERREIKPALSCTICFLKCNMNSYGLHEYYVYFKELSKTGLFPQYQNSLILIHIEIFLRYMFLVSIYLQINEDL